MAEAREVKRVLLIGEPGQIQEQITTALTAEASFQLIDLMISTERLARDVSAAEPDIILVDSQLDKENTLDLIGDLALQFPEVSIVAILPDEDTLSAQQVMLAGARAFLVQPFTQINLISTLQRVSTLEAARKRVQAASRMVGEEGTRPIKVLTVFSPKGGVGCTTVAINLALAFLEKVGGRVLLMDGKLFFGHMDMALNIRSKNSVADLIPHVSNLDDRLIDDVVYKHASGLHILLGPQDVQIGQGIRPDDLFGVLIALQRRYDLIIVDAGSALNENAVTLMDSADRVLLITAPDLAALHDTSNFIQFSRTLSYPLEKLLVVVNRANLNGGIRNSDIETALRQQVFQYIPDDEPNALRSLNRGVPYILGYPRTPVSQAYQQLSKQLSNLREVEISEAASVTRDATTPARAAA